jgi:ferric-dicitrate binding protein FerR (iron transport regulator)
VLAAATGAFHAKAAQRRQRRWMAVAAVAASLTAGIAVWLVSPAGRRETATVAHAAGTVEVARAGQNWAALGGQPGSLGTGHGLRTGRDGRVALALEHGASLRLAGATEIVLDAPDRIYLRQGTIYIDSGIGQGVSPLAVLTPAGTARDIGTQFELQVEGVRLRLRVREGRVAVDRGGQTLTGAAGEQVELDELGGITRAAIAADAEEWRWAEALAPVPATDGLPAAGLIAWAARESGRRLRYESQAVEARAAAVILHGNIRHLPPLDALEAMLATTDLEFVLDGDTMEIRARSNRKPEP